MKTDANAPLDFRTFLRRVHYLFGLVSPFVAIMIVGGYLQKYYAANEASDWPQTQGTIVSKDTVTVEQSGSSRTAGGGSSTTTVEKVRVIYKYRVGGETFTSNEIYAGRGDLYDSYLTWQYEIGENVAVYYHPDRPGKAALLRNVGLPATILYSLLFVVFSALAASVYGPMIARKRRGEPAIRSPFNTK